MRTILYKIKKYSVLHMHTREVVSKLIMLKAKDRSCF